MISFVSLLRYLIDSQLTESVISRMVGASKRKVSLLIFGECFVLSAGPCCAGLLLHKLLYNTLFERLNMTKNLIYEPGDYGTVLLIMLGITFAVIFLSVLKYLKLTPVESVRSRE